MIGPKLFKWGCIIEYYREKKSHIRETLNLLACAVSSTNTIKKMFCIHSNSGLRTFKFHSSMQITLCIHVNSTVLLNGEIHKTKQKKTKTIAGRLSTISQQKLLNLRSMSFSLRNLLRLVNWTFNPCK